MPRQRPHDIRFETRLERIVGATGRPAAGGITRVGSQPRRGGGQQSAIVQPLPEAETDGAAQLLVLSATADSIASGGDYIEFDTIVAQHGFEGVPTASGGQWVHPVSGVYNLILVLEWDTYEGGGLIELEIDGAVVAGGTIVSDGAGSQAIGMASWKAQAGTVGRVKVTQTSGSAQTCSVDMTISLPDPDDVDSIPAPNLLWLDAADLDTAGALSSWTDKSGAGNTVTQGTAASQPTVVLDELNGNPVVRFDGTDDRFSLAAIATSSAQPITVFALVKNSDAGPFENIREVISCDPPGASTRACEIGIQSTGVPADEGKWIIGSASGTNLTGPEANTSWHVLEAVFDGPDSLIAIDGGIVASGEAGAGAFEGVLHVGGRFTDYWQGDMAEIRAFSGALTAGVRRAVREDMRRKWAL